ncbi:hypothetical protein [Methylobacterium sp. WL103]|uniref:hypothetical protein n=1 Tax=Methylobacterium sp. WL103 TaxID=2603891 RepID=UPI001AEEF65C|nr:hypothetical protein [Methylobacterium sp. WL103]
MGILFTPAAAAAIAELFAIVTGILVSVSAVNGVRERAHRKTAPETPERRDGHPIPAR